MLTSSEISALEEGGYQFEKMLLGGGSPRAFLCLDERGKRVVMKRLDADCLHRDQLHPAIRDRLARVRELPHPRLAILRGVERFDELVCMVWNHVDGLNWDEAELAAGIWVDRARDLISAVDLLHVQGIVHGSLHGRNIIVADTGEIWLTDVSPYLYADTLVDIDALVILLRDPIAGRENLDHARMALDRFDPERDNLSDLANAMMDKGDLSASDRPSDDRGVRWRSIAGAVFIGLICVVIAVVAHSKMR